MPPYTEHQRNYWHERLRVQASGRYQLHHRERDRRTGATGTRGAPGRWSVRWWETRSIPGLNDINRFGINTGDLFINKAAVDRSRIGSVANPGFEFILTFLDASDDGGRVGG